MKKETQEGSEKESEIMRKNLYRTVVLQSHAVGEITACPGCITEMTLILIKYV